MDLKNEKCVMVINETLPLGLIANTAGILGMTIGKQVPEIVGSDVNDKDGNHHKGIVAIPVPILKVTEEKLKTIRQQLFDSYYDDVTIVDFSDIAQSCKVYEEYIEKAANANESEFIYFGIGLCGPKKKVNKLTGDLPLLR